MILLKLCPATVLETFFCSPVNSVLGLIQPARLSTWQRLRFWLAANSAKNSADGAIGAGEDGVISCNHWMGF